MSNIYLNGTVINAGKLVKFNGTDMANVYLNGKHIITFRLDAHKLIVIERSSHSRKNFYLLMKKYPSQEMHMIQ